jgi:magnesium chelatase family protein
MYAKLCSACIYGVNGALIEVEIDLTNGLPQTYIVGLPDSAIREAVDRVRAAIKNCNFTYPVGRITINLAPADMRKEGASFDLAIAIGILIASGQLGLAQHESMLIIGELALNGTIRPVRGILPMVDLAKQQGFKAVLVPSSNIQEASLVQGIEVYGMSHLCQLLSPNSVNTASGLDHLKADLVSVKKLNHVSSLPSQDDYQDVLGQHHVKRALTIAAAGMHNLILVGPPGTGKSMLIKRLPTILPPLTNEQALEVTKIYSSAGRFHVSPFHFITDRPFRAPHHTISASGLAGGGLIPKPGEISLAHHGVLFLDELPEFKREALEVLRQPLEEHQVTISRSKASFTFPAQFLLAASLNPCPCGQHLRR